MSNYGELSGNKGEWSEVYVLLALLAEGKLHPGDAGMEKLTKFVYPILQIIRKEIAGNTTFNVTTPNIEILFPSGEQLIIPQDKFKKEAEKLLLGIKMLPLTTHPDVEPFLRQIGVQHLSSSASQKTDIRIVLHDIYLGIDKLFGFSIKSYLGNTPTLLNASQSTNFLFRIEGDLPLEAAEKINGIGGNDKIKKRIKAIRDAGCNLCFEKMLSDCYYNNLRMIDSKLPRILAQLILLYFSGRGKTIAELVQIIQKDDPMGYATSTHDLYGYKIKKFLVEVALGMTPTAIWDGVYDATGGYIVVKEDGDIVCYHFYNRNPFEDYLFHNTHLDTPSSSRNKFGVIEDGGIMLNAQIRFLNPKTRK